MMKARFLTLESYSPLSRNIVFAAGIALFSGLAMAQEGSSTKELEKNLEEQRIALQEAISNRESTAAKVEEVKGSIAEAEERRAKIEEELKSLCEEQESLKEGSYDECMSSLES